MCEPTEPEGETRGEPGFPAPASGVIAKHSIGMFPLLLALPKGRLSVPFRPCILEIRWLNLGFVLLLYTSLTNRHKCTHTAF